MHPLIPRLKAAFVDQGKFLVFLLKTKDYKRLGWEHVAVGLLFTWLVGIARNWDYANADVAARLGLYSIAYVFLLSPLIWALTIPLQVEESKFVRVLAAVCMTAPYGLIYGIPVEMMFETDTAAAINLWFLGIVATFRVASLGHFLVLGICRSITSMIGVLSLPICIIAVLLTITGRSGKVIELMSGLRQDEQTAREIAGASVNAIGVLAVCLAPIALVIYIGICIHKHTAARN